MCKDKGIIINTAHSDSRIVATVPDNAVIVLDGKRFSIAEDVERAMELLKNKDAYIVADSVEVVNDCKPYPENMLKYLHSDLLMTYYDNIDRWKSNKEGTPTLNSRGDGMSRRSIHPGECVIIHMQNDIDVEGWVVGQSPRYLTLKKQDGAMTPLAVKDVISFTSLDESMNDLHEAMENIREGRRS